MSGWWKSFLHYPRTLRYGLFALLAVIFLLIAVRVLLHHFVAERNTDTPADLENAMLALEKETAENDDRFANNDDAPLPTSEPFPFNPNTLDSNGFIKLGLRPKTTHMLLNWRRKGKTFYKAADFEKVWTLKPEEYARLAPFIRIDEQPRFEKYSGNFSKFSNTPLPEFIDLNTTDSTTLVRLNGIGAVLAHKIMQRRNALGGFLKIEQLNEVYRFPDTTFEKLKQKLVIRPEAIQKIHVNNATEENLAAHPYIGEKTAKNIIMMRDALHGFQKMEQLKQVPFMNEEIYRKIAPYLSIQ